MNSMLAPIREALNQIQYLKIQQENPPFNPQKRPYRQICDLPTANARKISGICGISTETESQHEKGSELHERSGFQGSETFCLIYRT